VLASTSSRIFVGGILVFVVAMIAVVAITAEPWLAALMAACLAAVFNLWAWRRAEMFPIPKENAKAAAVANWFVMGFYALCVLFN
jgi:hypothetical protein